MDSRSRLSDVRWLFFDMGSTLMNERRGAEDLVQQVVKAAGDLGLQVSRDDVNRAFETAYRSFAPRLLAGAVQTLVEDPDGRAAILGSVGYRADLDEPYPDAAPVLSALAERYRIGVIANQPFGTSARLARHGLAPFISHCLSSAETGVAKPDAAIFRLALEKAECDPHHALMVGDRIDNDIRPAKLQGWSTIRVLRGPASQQAPRDPMDEADFTVSNLSEILGILT